METVAVAIKKADNAGIQRLRKDGFHQFFWQWLTVLTPVSPRLEVTASEPEKMVRGKL